MRHPLFSEIAGESVFAPQRYAFFERVVQPHQNQLLALLEFAPWTPSEHDRASAWFESLWCSAPEAQVLIYRLYADLLDADIRLDTDINVEVGCEIDFHDFVALLAAHLYCRQPDPDLRGLRSVDRRADV